MELAGILDYLVFFLTYCGIYAVFALGLNLQWGFTGQFNIGIAGFYAVGAYVSAIATTPPSDVHLGGFDLPFVFGALLAVVASGIVALLIGWITMRLRTDYLAIATIGIAEIIRLLLKNEEEVTNGVRGIPAIPRPVEGEVMMLGLVLLSVLGVYILIEVARKSPWGRVLRAIRENENATLAAGKDVARFRLEAFVVGSAIMGFGGALFSNFQGFISPEAFDPLYATFVIWVMLIAGGSGNNKGAVLGVVVIWGLMSLTETLTQRLLPPEMMTQAGTIRILLIGVLLQVILLYRPEGLLPEEKPKLKRPGS